MCKRFTFVQQPPDASTSRQESTVPWESMRTARVGSGKEGSESAARISNKMCE